MLYSIDLLSFNRSGKQIFPFQNCSKFCHYQHPPLWVLLVSEGIQLCSPIASTILPNFIEIRPKLRFLILPRTYTYYTWIHLYIRYKYVLRMSWNMRILHYSHPRTILRNLSGHNNDPFWNSLKIKTGQSYEIIIFQRDPRKHNNYLINIFMKSHPSIWRRLVVGIFILLFRVNVPWTDRILESTGLDFFPPGFCPRIIIKTFNVGRYEQTW